MKTSDLLLILVFALLCFCGGYKVAKHHFEDTSEMMTDTVYVVRWDTLTIEKPTEIVRYVDRFDTIRLTDESVIVVTIDSTAIIPIECATYKDSTENAKYEAFLSGFRAQLDSIRIECMNTETIITETKTVPGSRWGVGIQAGIGYSGKFSPYIGIGVQYRLWQKK